MAPGEPKGQRAGGQHDSDEHDVSRDGGFVLIVGGHAWVPAAVIHRYQPIYSVNETHWWLHRKG